MFFKQSKFIASLSLSQLPTCYNGGMFANAFLAPKPKQAVQNKLKLAQSVYIKMCRPTPQKNTPGRQFVGKKKFVLYDK